MSNLNARLSPDDPRHGTANGYGNPKCRCSACREANCVNHARYMAKVRAEERILSDHGTALAYDSGCRCEQCRSAHNAKSRAYKAKLRANQRGENAGALPSDLVE